MNVPILVLIGLILAPRLVLSVIVVGVVGYVVAYGLFIGWIVIGGLLR